MKKITHILVIILTCLFASASALAQDANEAYKTFRRMRDARNPSPELFQKMAQAGVAHVLVGSEDPAKANAFIGELYTFGPNIIKNKAQITAWNLTVQFAIIDSLPKANDKAKGVLAALSASLADVEMTANPSMQNLVEWRKKIDQLTIAPNGLPFLLDREKAFYNYVSTNIKGSEKSTDALLANLSKSKDADTAKWAKQEIAKNEIRKAPLTLSFTALDGKTFDSAKLNGNPAIFVYFWSTTARDAAKNMERVVDMYSEFSRKQIEFIAVCCDPEAKRAEVEAFVKKAKIKFPVYFDGKGTKGELCQQRGVTNIPTALLFDDKGMLVGSPAINVDDLKKYIR